MKLLKQLWKAALIAGFVAASGAAVAAEPFKLLNPAQAVETKGKVEVIEFYWYGCPHCYHLEPKLNAWLAKLPKDVAFRRIPAVWNPRMEAHAKLFHALESLGLSEQLHGKLFDATQKDNIETHDKDTVANWLSKQGVDKTKFLASYTSFGVENQARRDGQLTRSYQVTGVPAFVVGGKYLTNVGDAGGEEQLFQVLDKLIDEERKALKPAAKK